MESFLKLSAEDQRIYCEQAGATLGLPPASVEKDYWVCYVLRELFGLPNVGGFLTFKGGTSLAKGWGLIQRFSEDIDLVIDREALGVARTPPKSSGKTRRKYLDELQELVHKYITETLTTQLQARLSKSLPPSLKWSLRPSEDDPDNEVLLFSYASHFDGDGYLAPVVKIEPGARSDTAPTESRNIEPFLKSLLPIDPFEVRCVHPTRTFWEKAMLLHEELSRPAPYTPKLRLARHCYDVVRLIQAGIGDDALADKNLYSAVAEHRAVFFRKAAEVHETMRPGSFLLVPKDEQRAPWQRDYEAMRESMFYGPPAPRFGELLEVLAEFENRLNAT